MLSKLLTLVFCCALASPSPFVFRLQDEERSVYAVVVHVDSKIEDLSSSDLKKYLKLDRRYWPDKSSVVLFQRPASSDLQKYLFDEVYGMTERQLRRQFVSLMNKGAISAIPSVVSKKSMVCRLVAKKNGGLAVIIAKDIPDTVKVLKIDGKKYTDDDYPLVRITKEKR